MASRVSSLDSIPLEIMDQGGLTISLRSIISGRVSCQMRKTSWRKSRIGRRAHNRSEAGIIEDNISCNISSLSINKVEDAGELPGLMIEEMMESASMVNGEDNHGKMAKDNGLVCLLIPLLIYFFLLKYISNLNIIFSDRSWLSARRGPVLGGGGRPAESSSEVETVNSSQHGGSVRPPAGGLDSGADGQVREREREVPPEDWL